MLKENIRLPEKSPITDLRDYLGRYVPDETGTIGLNPEESEHLGELLGKLGVTGEQPSEKEDAGQAAWVADEIQTGVAPSKLHRLAFVGDSKFLSHAKGAEKKEVELTKPIYIKPEYIISAAGFESWMGRGPNGTQSMTDRQTGEIRTSMETILDYATRPTAIPSVYMDVLVRPDGEVLALSNNAHRAAAAKLRAQPLAADSLIFHFLED
jgi:hypothetical protein